MNTSDVSVETYTKVAYIEIFIYTVLGLYLIQKYLLKNYIEEVTLNITENSQNPDSIIKSAVVGMSPIEAFNNLIINRVKLIFSGITNKFYSMFNSIGDMLSKQLESIDGVRNFMKPMREFIKDATLYFYKMIEKFSLSIMYTFYRLRHTLNRSLSGFNLIFHTLENSKNMILSVLNSSELSYLARKADTIYSVGNNFNRILCFTEDTPIELQDSIKPISHLKCGMLLKNGSFITSVIEFTNSNIVYKGFSDKLKRDIFVSPKHMICEDGIWITVKDSKYFNKTNIVPRKLYCISTSDHIINIGEFIFRDYEELSSVDTYSKIVTGSINHMIFKSLNKHLSPLKNMNFVTPVKHLDSGLEKNTNILMNDGTYKPIRYINVGDLLDGNNRVLGKIDLLARDHLWFSYNNIIMTDNSKIFDGINWKNVGYGNPISIGDEYGYNIITETGEFKVTDSKKIYRIRDFLQITNKLTLDDIEEYTLSFMNINKNR
jgi:hypothetical protein